MPTRRCALREPVSTRRQPQRSGGRRPSPGAPEFVGMLGLLTLSSALVSVSAMMATPLACGSDGLPHAAPASPLGHYCEVLDAAPILYAVIAVVPPLITILVACTGTRTQRRTLSGAAAGIGLGICIFALAVLPRTCASEDPRRGTKACAAMGVDPGRPSSQRAERQLGDAVAAQVQRVVERNIQDGRGGRAFAGGQSG
jgi:hypothetical protein